MATWMGGPRPSNRVLRIVGLVGVLFCLILPFVYGIPYISRDYTSTAPALRILPLGDSITWGWQPEHREDGTNGYRAELLKGLLDAGYKVDFVGSQHSGDMVDNDNEGYPGYTISQIDKAMSAGLDMRPNVVLLHAGTNDLSRPETTEPWSEAPKRLGGLIDDVLKACPDVVVLVAKIIQFDNEQAMKNIAAFNAKVPEVVRLRVDKGFKLTIVDQSVIGVDELIDGVHPNDAGYAHMGRIWAESVKAVVQKGLVTPPV